VQHEWPGQPRKRASDRPLVQYRLYFLQGVDTLISYSHEFEAEDDEHAIKVAHSWLEGRRAELWCHERKVKSWERTR